MAPSYDSDGLHLVVGLGSAGSRHLALLEELGVKRIGVVRSYLGPTNRPTPTGVEEFQSLTEALTHNPAAMVIATPTYMHYAQTLAALEAGVPALVEKPMATKLAETEELVSIARSTGVQLHTGYHLRHHPIVAWLRETIMSEVLGSPLFLNATWGEYLPDWHPGENYRESYSARRDQGGGPLLTLSHVVDYAVQLMGEGDRVGMRSLSLSALDIQVPDTVILSLTHARGGLSTLEMDFWTRPRQHRLELRFEKGVVVWNVLSDSVSIESTPELLRGLREVPKMFSRQRCFEAQMRSFLTSLRHDMEPDYNHELSVARILDEDTS